MTWGAGVAPVDVARLDDVRDMADPVARNRAITETYHALALGMRSVVGPDDATWCAFAVWASRTAGAEIRMDEFPAVVRRHLEGSPDYHEALTALGRRIEHTHVAQLVDDAAVTVSRSIAAGNTLVFSELGPAFAALVDRRPLPPGLPDAVVEAATVYSAAGTTDDPRTRAQLVLYANLVAVLHEQTRLQDPIATALDAAPTDELHHLARRRLLDDVYTSLRQPLDVLGHALERAWEEALTATMMTLTTSDEVLRLDRDVPALPGLPLFPEELCAPMLDSLADFCSQHDRTGFTGIGSGARDWRDLSQRMTYILNLFRSRQRHPALFAPPYPQ